MIHQQSLLTKRHFWCHCKGFIQPWQVIKYSLDWIKSLKIPCDNFLLEWNGCLNAIAHCSGVCFQNVMQNVNLQRASRSFWMCPPNAHNHPILIGFGEVFCVRTWGAEKVISSDSLWLCPPHRILRQNIFPNVRTESAKKPTKHWRALYGDACIQRPPRTKAIT